MNNKHPLAISRLTEEDRLAALSSKGRDAPGKHGDFTRTRVGYPGSDYFRHVGKHAHPTAPLDGPSMIEVKR